MARLPLLRRFPVVLLAQAAMAARRHWNLLAPKERAELARIVRKSRGRPGNLTPREREQLRKLVIKLDLLTLGRTLAPFGRGLRRGRR
jgi:hypothetical protein